MATLITTEHDNGSKTAKNVLGSQTVYDRYDLAAALALNDVIRSVYIPKNAVLLDAMIVVDDLDTDATPLLTLTLRVNDLTTQKDFFVASTVGRAGGTQRASVAAGNALGYEVGNDDFFLELLVAAAPGTGAVTGDIELFVSYTIDRIHDDL